MEQESEPVVLEIPHPVRDVTDLLGDEVLGFDRTRRDAGHVEVEDLGLPVRDGGGEAGELGDSASAAYS